MGYYRASKMVGLQSLDIILDVIAFTKRQEDVLRFLRGHGQVKSPQIEAALKLTRARVNQILKPLVEAGLVVQLGQTRATVYRLK